MRTIHIDLRVISATNKDLRHEMEHERFRPDLFYRIITLSLLVPPIRERKEDILTLTKHFMARHGYDFKNKMISKEAIERIKTYHWPGNVRQLENAVERAIHLAQGKVLEPAHFGIEDFHGSHVPISHDSMLCKLTDVEKKVILKTLKAFNRNISQSAKSLGISRPTLYRKMQEYEILTMYEK